MEMIKMKKVVGALVVVALAAGLGFYFMRHNASPSDGKVVQGGAVLATVDGYKITEAELAPMLTQGVDKAVALDRRITQSVIAKAAEAKYHQEAEILMQANRNDILYQLFLSKRADEIKKAITDQDISAFYQKNVKDEDYKSAVMKIYLTSDAREAQGMYESLSGSKDREATLAKMNYMQKDGDHFLPLQNIPYNLGQLVKKMSPGQAMQPIVIREGVLIAYVENIKSTQKPTLEATKDEIKMMLVNQRLSDEVQGLRKAAAIELKG
jgi:parvulin-like peptidyl-prolyl isomerase